MTKRVYLLLLSLLPVLLIESFARSKPFLDNVYHYIENVEIYEVGQEPPHVPIVPYSSLEDALSFRVETSKSTLLLNGDWKFFFVKKPDLVQKDFFRSDFKDESWSYIPVPSNWQMQGYETPKFRNISRPFTENPPYIPHEYNPAGMYRHEFTLPQDWEGKEIFLRFEGVASASFVWMNGEEVGYNQGAMEPAEYNVTGFLKQGKNLLSVSVYTYCDGVYLEQQDMWRLAGIFRDVKLVARPKSYIHDYYITTDLDDGYEHAVLNVGVEVRNRKSLEKKGLLSVDLYDYENRLVESVGKIPFSSIKRDKVNFSKKIIRPRKWNAEKPYLYKLVFTMTGQERNTKEVLSAKVGFRKIEYRNRALLVNGVPVKLNGVNSHQQHPYLGHSMDIETIRKDFSLMKRFNINHVRTCHYPPVYEYLQLADEYGIYVIDETGNEAHDTEYLSEDKNWLPQYLDRVKQMVYRDRNHPSVIIWSAGNESGEGDNICETIAEGKRIDPSRPAWMYGGNTEDRYPGMGMACEDIIGPRYPTSFELEERVGKVSESMDPRPAYMDEYLSAAGNSLGALDEFWEVIYKYPRCIGGALWDWVSPGITQKLMTVSDVSPNRIQTHLMGQASLTDAKFGKGIYLSGNDEWIELYRDPELDITGKALTLSLWIKPEPWNGFGPLLTKGRKQFGLKQVSATALEFYIGDEKKHSLITALPGNWVNHWHHLAATYNGQEMCVFIDGEIAAKRPCSIAIRNYPWQVNVGKDADSDGSALRGYLLNATVDRISVFDKVIPVGKLFSGADLSAQAKLWLDLDEVNEAGEFFSLGIGARSYGIVWPDRSVQPEVWQIKKSAQPIKVEWMNKTEGVIKITNRFGFTDLKELQMNIQLSENGVSCLSWTENPALAPLESMTYRLEKLKDYPFEIGKAYRVLVSFCLIKPEIWASPGFEVAFEDLELYKGNISESYVRIPSTRALVVEEDSLTIKVKGENFEYDFGKRSGTLESLIYQGVQYLKKGPIANVWRAPLANEIDSWAKEYGRTGTYVDGYGLGTANVWYAHQLDKIQFASGEASLGFTDENQVIVNLKNVQQADTFRTAVENKFIYTIDRYGSILLEHTLTPWGDWPNWIPKVGLQFSLDSQFEKMTWYGKGPYENYCDRKSGYKTGLYSMKISEMYEPYLIPQEHGNRSDVSYLKLENEAGAGLEIYSDIEFNASASHLTSDNLTRAAYPFQLRPVEDVIVNIDYVNSGVGCTATSTVNRYRAYPCEYTFKLKICPYSEIGKN